jgi:universal stress protein A
MTFKKILVAINDSEPAMWALDVAASMTSEQHGELCLLHVVNRLHAPPPELDCLSTELLDELRARAVDLLTGADDRVPAAIKRVRVIREGKPADEVLAAARELEADLIVMGTHGRSRLSHLLLGSTAEAVVRQATCPVLTVPKKPAESPIAAKRNGKSAAKQASPVAIAR